MTGMDMGGAQMGNLDGIDEPYVGSLAVNCNTSPCVFVMTAH